MASKNGFENFSFENQPNNFVKNSVFMTKFVKIMHKEVKQSVFTKKFVKTAIILLSGMHQKMASKIGINFLPREKTDAKIQCHPLSKFQAVFTKKTRQFDKFLAYESFSRKIKLRFPTKSNDFGYTLISRKNCLATGFWHQNYQIFFIEYTI